MTNLRSRKSATLHTRIPRQYKIDSHTDRWVRSTKLPPSLGLGRMWPCCHSHWVHHGRFEHPAHRFCSRNTKVVVVVVWVWFLPIAESEMSAVQLRNPWTVAGPVVPLHPGRKLCASSQATRVRRHSGPPKHRACVSALAQGLRRVHGRKNTRISAHCSLCKPDVGHRTTRWSGSCDAQVGLPGRLTLVLRRRQAVQATSICARFFGGCPLEPESAPEAATDLCSEDMLVKADSAYWSVMRDLANSGKVVLFSPCVGDAPGRADTGCQTSI